MSLSHIRHKPKQVKPKVVSPPQSNAIILILISRNLEPIFVSFGGSFYMHGVTRLLKCFKLNKQVDSIYHFTVNLRWLVTVSSTLQDLEFDGSL